MGCAGWNELEKRLSNSEPDELPVAMGSKSSAETRIQCCVEYSGEPEIIVRTQRNKYGIACHFSCHLFADIFDV